MERLAAAREHVDQRMNAQFKPKFQSVPVLGVTEPYFLQSRIGCEYADMRASAMPANCGTEFGIARPRPPSSRGLSATKRGAFDPTRA